MKGEFGFLVQSNLVKHCRMFIPSFRYLMCFSGDITQKGYEKKRAKLLGPYLSRGKKHCVKKTYKSYGTVQNRNIDISDL